MAQTAEKLFEHHVIFGIRPPAGLKGLMWPPNKLKLLLLLILGFLSRIPVCRQPITFMSAFLSIGKYIWEHSLSQTKMEMLWWIYANKYLCFIHPDKELFSCTAATQFKCCGFLSRIFALAAGYTKYYVSVINVYRGGHSTPHFIDT